jgi:hypothetical protein
MARGLHQSGRMNVGKALITAALVAGGGLVAGATDQTKPAVMGLVTRPLPKQIETQGRIIYIKAREGKPTRFTVKTRDGKVLAKKATLDELQHKDPALAHFVRHALTVHRTTVRNTLAANTQP